MSQPKRHALAPAAATALETHFFFTKKNYRILQGCGNSLKFDICATVTIFTATEGFTPSMQGQVAWAASETPKADAYRVKICEHIALKHLSLGHAHGKTVSGDTKAFKFWNGSPPMLKPLFFILSYAVYNLWSLYESLWISTTPWYFPLSNRLLRANEASSASAAKTWGQKLEVSERTII